MTAKEEREKRLAAQLRANLRRRKAAPLEDLRHPGLEPGSRSLAADGEGSGTPGRARGDN